MRRQKRLVNDLVLKRESYDKLISLGLIITCLLRTVLSPSWKYTHQRPQLVKPSKPSKIRLPILATGLGDLHFTYASQYI